MTTTTQSVPLAVLAYQTPAVVAAYATYCKMAERYPSYYPSVRDAYSAYEARRAEAQLAHEAAYPIWL
jgi:hypothetical protein